MCLYISLSEECTHAFIHVAQLISMHLSLLLRVCMRVCVQPMGACGRVSLTISGIEVQAGSHFQAARLAVQPINSLPADPATTTAPISGGTSSSGGGAAANKQSIVQTGPVALPMQQQLWLDLPLGAGTIHNHVLRLRFSLGLSLAAAATRAPNSEPVCLDSTLEVSGSVRSL